MSFSASVLSRPDKYEYPFLEFDDEPVDAHREESEEPNTFTPNEMNLAYSSGEEVFSEQEESDDQESFISRDDPKEREESDMDISDDDRPLIEFKVTESKKMTTKTGFRPGFLKPTDSDPNAWSAYHGNKFKGWPLEAKEELLRLRFDEFGQELDAHSANRHRSQIWSKIVSRFNKKFPEYNLTNHRAQQHLRNYREKYKAGLNPGRKRRPPHWDLYARYFSGVRDSNETQEKMAEYEVGPRSATERGIDYLKLVIEPKEDLNPNPTETLSFQIDAYIVKLRMTKFKARFEGAWRGSKRQLWDEIASQVKRTFKQSLTGLQVQNKFSEKKCLYRSGKLSESRREVLSEFFEAEEGLAGSRPIYGEENPASREEKKRLSEDTQCPYAEVRIPERIPERYQDELRAFQASAQAAANLFTDLIML